MSRIPQLQWTSRRALISRLFLLIVGVCISISATLRFPLAFGTNDDVSLKALANGTYSGEPEYKLTFMSPIYGRLLEFGYTLIPNFDWYVFFLIFFQLISLIAILRLLGPQQNIALAILVTTFGIFAFTKLFLPLQFTGASTIVTLAGIFVLFDFSKPSAIYRTALGLLLLSLGVAIRWEAGILVYCLFTPPIVVSAWMIKTDTARSLMTRTGISTTPLLVMLFANRWNTVAASALHHSPIQRIHEIERRGQMIPGISKSSIELLLETRGMYFDRLTELSALVIKPDESLIERLTVALGKTLPIIVSRPYFAFIIALAALISVVVFSGKFHFRLTFIVLGLQISIFVLLLSYLNTTYERLPYRLLMPLWTALVLTCAFLLRQFETSRSSSTLQKPIDISQNIIQFRTARWAWRLNAVTCLLLSMVFIGSTGRYVSNYFNRHDSMSQQLSERVAVASCLSVYSSMIFVMYPDDSLVPGGDLVPAKSDSIFSYPVLDNGGLQHSAVYRKRINFLKIQRDDSVVRMMVANHAIIITSPEIASLLASLHNELSPDEIVYPRSHSACGVSAWQLAKSAD